MGKYNISEEERQRRREHAKKLGESRKGTTRKSNDPQAKSANEAVANWTKEHPTQIIAALKRCLDSDSPTTVIKAALALLEIEARVDATKKPTDLSNLDQNELAELLAEKFSNLKSRGIDISALIKEHQKD